VGGKAGRGGASSGTVDGTVTTKEGAGAGGRGAKSIEAAPHHSLSVGIGKLRGGPTPLNMDSRKMGLYEVHSRET